MEGGFWQRVHRYHISAIISNEYLYVVSNAIKQRATQGRNAVTALCSRVRVWHSGLEVINHSPLPQESHFPFIQLSDNWKWNMYTLLIDKGFFHKDIFFLIIFRLMLDLPITKSIFVIRIKLSRPLLTWSLLPICIEIICWSILGQLWCWAIFFVLLRFRPFSLDMAFKSSCKFFQRQLCNLLVS